MKKTPSANSKGKKSRPKAKLGIPDLEQSKAAVLRSLGSPDSRRGYQHAIDEFVAWYCSEPRLAFNKTVVLRYRFHLEERGLAPGTINVRSPLIYTIDRVPTGILIRIVARVRTDAALRNCCRAFRRSSLQRGEMGALKAL